LNPDEAALELNQTLIETPAQGRGGKTALS